MTHGNLWLIALSQQSFSRDAFAQHKQHLSVVNSTEELKENTLEIILLSWHVYLN